MKEKLTKNSGLKLLSLFCAFFVWLAVVNVANPTKVDSKEVPVEIINPQVLERANMTYEIVGKKTASISYKIRTKDAYKMKPSSFRAYADLSEMYDVTGAIPIKVEVLENDELLQTSPTVKSPEVIKIKTEELQTKRFPLKAHPFGTPSEGYVAGEISMSPDFDYVKGPVSMVGQINSVGIEFDVEGAVSDVSGIAQPAFYDANGNRLTELEESVKSLSGDISYTMQILKVKNLPLNFVVTGEVAPGYRHTGVECDIKEVPVAGLKSVLASISNLTIQSPELSIDKATGDKVCEIDLSDFIEPNIQIAGMDDTKIEVTLKVEQLRDKTYEIESKNIPLENASETYDYEIADEKADIVVRGLKEDLDSLSADKMNVHIDVAGLEPGTHTVKAETQLDNAYEVRTYPECQVIITQKTPEESTAPSVEETHESKADVKEKESKAGESKAESKAENSTAATKAEG